MNKQVVVLGMHRSGTSTVAMILKELGINMGDRLLGTNSGNPFGHGEDEDFLDLNEMLIKDAKGSWDFPPKQDKLKSSFESHKDQIKELIDGKNVRTLWGWKEPRTTLLASYYHDMLENVYYIYVDRDALEVAKSLKKRGRMPIKKGLKLTQWYKNEYNLFLNKYNPSKVMYVNFRELHAQKQDIISNFIEFLEIDPTPDQVAKAIQVIKPLGKVRTNREQLRKKESINNYKKIFKHPIRFIKKIFREGWRYLKYHLGV